MGSDWLEVLKKKQQRAAQLREELATIEAELRDARAILAGRFGPSESSPRPKSRHGFTEGRRARPIQERSSVWFSREVLKEAGEALLIDELLRRVNARSIEQFKKPTLVSNLSRYVAHGDTFTRPARSTFGLVEWDHEPEQNRFHRFDEPVPADDLKDLEIEPKS